MTIINSCPQPEHLFRTIFEQAAVGLAYVSLQGQFLQLNSRFCEISGYSQTALTQLSFQELIYADDLVADLAQYNRLLAGEIQNYTLEQRSVHANGTVVWINLTVSLVRNAEGEPDFLIAMLEDISARKQAEAEHRKVALELAASKEMYAKILSSISDAVFITDDAGSLRFICPNAAIIFGYSDAEIAELGNIQNLLGPDLFKLTNLQEQGEITNIERDIRDKAGQLHTILVNAKQVAVANGTVLYCCRDITNRKQTETALYKAQQVYQEAERLAHLGSWELDYVTHSLYWSAEVFAIFEQDSQQLEASYEAFLKVIHPADRSGVKQAYKQHLRDRQPYNQVHRLQMPDGRIKYIREQCSTVFTAAGAPRLSRGIVQDITPLRSAQIALEKLNAELEQRVQNRTAALQNSEKRYRSLMNRASDAILITNQAGQLLECNQAAAKLLGYPTAALTQIHAFDLFPPETLNVLDQYLAKLRQGEDILLETLMLCQTGTTKSVEISACSLQLDGELIIQAIVRDITERKEYAAQLQQTNEELIRATRLKDEFLANMSHELRTPLNAVLGMTEGLQDEIFGPITARQANALQTIERSGSHLLELINEILDLAKIESGQIELELKPTAIAPLCYSSLTFIKQQAAKKHLQITAQIPDNLPQLLIDERRIRQVLINLLNNAVKFTPEGGQITLAVSYPNFTDLRTQPESNGPVLRIAVTDTGIGISPANIKKLFKPFIQIDSALNRKYEGTGLGLALTKRIVELHGGAVSLTSEAAVGSCFRIDLPCVVNTLANAE